MTAKLSESKWPQVNLSLHEYEACYVAALNRMAVVLNSSTGMLFRFADLSKDDAALERILKAKSTRLLHLNKNSPVFDESDEFRAENHFYGRFEFKRSNSKAPSKPTVVVSHEATDTFIEWSFKRLQRPIETDPVLGRSDFASEKDFAKACAANYLLKNFWHNFVHFKVQGISSKNYGEFGGDARFDSDFEADNLGNLLLLHSYGLKLFTSGKVGEESVSSMKAIFARNQCNLVFAERAKHRKDDRDSMTEEERWEDYEWQFRRRLSNSLSQRLALEGLAARTLAIYFTGKIKKGRNGPYRSNSRIVVNINNHRIATDWPPYLPTDGLPEKQPTKERQTMIRKMANERRQNASVDVIGKYRNVLGKNPELKEYAKSGLQEVFRRMGISLKA
jgi:hypothetical protein